MLKLIDIKKFYGDGTAQVAALNGVSLSFRKNEFVSILGPSGCGKTTLLNIVGGLDRYSYGDLVINGTSTKNYRDRDWDSYRNHTIGFVFQTYNLIPHLSVLTNVELALTLSGISKEERRNRAYEVLQEVGLSGQERKRPNQLSGGQMQRVAIARALVNNPDVILADEPTGALDSVTSIQIMELLKEVAKDRLVVMVTHNPDIAERYSTRIIRILDGLIVDDSDPFEYNEAKDYSDKQKVVAEESKEAQSIRKEKKKTKRPPKTSMSFLTAIYSSFKNLISKRGRTLMTCFAGSIGIIGIALVLSVSAGFSLFIKDFQQDSLGEYPLSVMQYNMDMAKMMSMMQSSPSNGNVGERPDRYPDYEYVIPYSSPLIEQLKGLITKNVFTDDYIEYLNAMNKDWVSGIQYIRPVEINLVSKTFINWGSGPEPHYKKVDRADANLQELIDNYEYMVTQYDVLDIEGKLPQEPNEVALVVDRYNRISVNILKALGIQYYSNGEDYHTISFEDVAKNEFSIVWNDICYDLNSKGSYDFEFADLDPEDMFEQGMKLNIVGIIRQNRNANMNWLRPGLVYSPALTDYIIEHEKNSQIVLAQTEAYNTYLEQIETNPQAKLIDVTTGKPMKSEWQQYLDMASMFGFSFLSNLVEFTAYDMYLAKLQTLGGTSIPSEIYIYPSTFENKAYIMDYLDAYNLNKEETDKIIYVDSSGNMFSMMETIVNVVSYILVAFSAISLVVSSIMIGIITYVSVIERTKEIGVLRSLGARKRDVSRIFNAETMIIGVTAGVIGVLITGILTLIVSAILKALSGISNLAYLNPLTALALVGISTLLTVISGLIPSRIAANKDPVVALRTE